MTDELPDEIAALIEYLQNPPMLYDQSNSPSTVMRKAAAALRALAQENARARAKTVEECAKEADSWGDTITARQVAVRIRALSQTDGGK